MDAPPSKPRRLRLQFGMRSALVLMTLAALGVALWTRWPYAVEENAAQALWRESGWRSSLYRTGAYNAFDNVVLAERETAYYRRLLGGQRLRHGESQLFLSNGNRVVERHFREGVLHGEYREWHATGGVRCEGEFNRGRKHGEWLFLGRPKREEAAGDYRRTQHWNLGVPHGEWKWEDGYGTVYLSVTFDTGRVITIDGLRVIDYLDDICRKLSSGSIADRWRLFHRYQADGGYPAWMKEPVTRWPNIDTELDPRLPATRSDAKPKLPGDVPYAVKLAMELKQSKRAATRRFNCLYITKPELLGPEHDLTGVSALAPEADSLVADLFATNVKLNGKRINYNLRQALHFFEHELGLPIDDSALAGTLEPRDEDRSWSQLGWYDDEHNVRDLLGLALHRARCRCELIRGVLVIKRQEPK